MKKVLILLLVLCLAIGAVGCVNLNKGEDDQSVSSQLSQMKLSKYVTLCEYEGVPVTAADLDPSDEDVQTELANRLSSYATTETVDRPAELGDTVTIDYTGYMDDVAFDGGSATDDDLVLGSGSFIDDFENQLVGHSAGDAVTVDVTFPDPYTNNPDYAGKDATFEVTVKAVKADVTPELTDEFAAQISDYQTADAYLASVKDDLRTTNKTNAVWDYLMENSVIESYPDGLVDEYYNQYIDMYQGYADQYGIDLDTMLSYMSKTTDTIRTDAENYASQDLVINAIAQKESIAVTQDDITAFLQENYPDMTEDEFYQQYTKDDLVQYLTFNKVSDLVVNAAVEQ